MSLGEVGGSRASRGRFTHSGEERPAWPHVPNGRACYSSAPHCRYEQVSSHSHRDEGSAPTAPLTFRTVPPTRTTSVVVPGNAWNSNTASDGSTSK